MKWEIMMKWRNEETEKRGSTQVTRQGNGRDTENCMLSCGVEDH